MLIHLFIAGPNTHIIRSLITSLDLTVQCFWLSYDLPDPF